MLGLPLVELDLKVGCMMKFNSKTCDMLVSFLFHLSLWVLANEMGVA